MTAFLKYSSSLPRRMFSCPTRVRLYFVCLFCFRLCFLFLLPVFICLFRYPFLALALITGCFSSKVLLRKASAARVNGRLRRYYLIVRLLPNVFALACLPLSSI